LDHLALAFNSTRGAHGACRSEEKTLKEEKAIGCNSCEQFGAGVTLPACALQQPITEQCIEILATWSAQANSIWKSEKSACDSSTSNHAEKQASCNTLQAEFESSFCVYASGLHLVCSNQETCRGTQIGLRNASHTDVAVAGSGFEAECEAAMHVKCLLRVLGAAGAGAQQGVLGACLSDPVNSSRLSIAYRPIPSPATCGITLVATVPCDEEWISAEFQGKPWSARAPAAACVPCSVQSTPTTTPTAAATTTSTARESSATAFCVIVDRESVPPWWAVSRGLVTRGSATPIQ